MTLKEDNSEDAKPASVGDINESEDSFGSGEQDAAKPGLARKLGSRHLIMLSIGSTIGTGFWLGIGSSLRTGGPAGLFLGFVLAGTIAFAVNQAIGELAILYPVPSAFAQWSEKLIDITPAFTCGWAYWFNSVVILANELQTFNTILGFWTDKVPAAAWVSIFIVVLFAIAVTSIDVFGELEVVLSAIKLLWIGVVAICFIVISAGGAPNHHKTGFEYWNSMPFTHGFKGFLAIMATCIMSMSGCELVGLTAAEAKDARRSVPKAANSAWIRLTIFYIIGALMVSITVSPLDNNIYGGSGTNASPYVAAFREAKLEGLAHAMNAVIFISVISSCNGEAYTAARTLVGMSNLGLAPGFLAKCDRRGVPWFATIATFIPAGGLSYLCVSNAGSTVFSWFSNLTSLCILWVWGTIFICHIRFRAAWKAQGRSTDELPWKTWTWPVGTYWGLLICILLIIVQFYLAIWPLGKPSSAKNFFSTFVSIVALLALYCLGKLWFRGPLFKRAADIDLDTGRVTYPSEEPDSEASVGSSKDISRFSLRRVLHRKSDRPNS